MTPQQLKNSILQWAIEGRLVEQRAEEGTARELLKEIQSEKARLVREGKIKKSKALPPITEEEKPFDIPEGWEWARFEDFALYTTDYVANGSFKSLRENVKTYKTKEYAILVKTQDFANNFSNDLTYTDKSGYEFLDKSRLDGGELMLSNIGASIGKAFIIPKLNYPMTLAPNSIMVKCFDEVTTYFLRYLMLSVYGQTVLKEFTAGTAMPKFSKTQLRSCVIPIPSYAEQKRILEKIEEILPLIDQYDKAYNQLTDFNTRFPEAMKKSLLQYAIQGKLVEQRADEGTAQDLIKEIQVEKKRLIEENKIKKTKALPPITEEEIPFDIPESWEWVRLGNIFLMQAGKNIKASCISDICNEHYKYLCYGGNGVRGYVENYNREGSFPIIGRQGALCGNIHMAEGKFYATEHAVVTETFADTNVSWAKYFLIALNLNQYATATAQPGLAVSKIENVLIPLPPLAEQNRIVAKLEELLPFCNQLRSKQN